MSFKNYEESDNNLDLDCKVSCNNCVFHNLEEMGW